MSGRSIKIIPSTPRQFLLRDDPPIVYPYCNIFKAHTIFGIATAYGPSVGLDP